MDERPDLQANGGAGAVGQFLPTDGVTGDGARGWGRGKAVIPSLTPALSRLLAVCPGKE